MNENDSKHSTENNISIRGIPSDKNLVFKWIGNSFTGMALNLLAIFGCFIGIIILLSLSRGKIPLRRGIDLVSVIISAPLAYMNIMSLVAVGSFILIIIYFVFSLFKKTFKLLIGPPKAGRTPGATIVNYFSNIVQTNITLHSWLDAYACLLDQAKETFLGYNGFKCFWKKVNAELTSAIKEYFHPHILSVTTWVVSYKPVGSFADGIHFFQVDYSVVGKESNQSVTMPGNITIGTMKMTMTVPLSPVDNRWYITNSEWEYQLSPKKM